MKRLLTAAILAILPCAGASLLRAGQDPAAGPVMRVTIRTQQDAVYPRSALILTMTFTNPGETPVTLDAEAFAPDRFLIVDTKGKGPGKLNREAPAARPLRIDGLETIEHEVNLSAWYPALTSKLRVWEITWSHGDMRPQPLLVKITRAYDPRKDRNAIVETDLGRMVWRLMPEHAPNHVKHFVDLVRQGFYDGLTIYKAAPGLIAEGGDPNGDGSGGWDRLLMPEMSKTVSMKMGLVGSLRRESSVTNNSIFFITLGQNDYMAGLQTFFAEVTSGIEVVAKLYRVPNRGDTGDAQAFLLTPPVKIQRITIKR